MNYLLDTHTFLWALFEPAKLSLEAKEILQSLESRLYVSVISLWEISLKFAMGKLVLKNCAPEDLLKASKRLNLEILDLDSSQATSFHHLPRTTHKDPFDRMIVWQAIQNRLILITKDQELESYKKLGLKILW